MLPYAALAHNERESGQKVIVSGQLKSYRKGRKNLPRRTQRPQRTEFQNFSAFLSVLCGGLFSWRPLRCITPNEIPPAAADGQTPPAPCGCGAGQTLPAPAPGQNTCGPGA